MSMFVLLCLPSILNKAVLDPLSPEIGIHLSEGKAFSISKASNASLSGAAILLPCC